jgi:uncharacterized protein
MLLPEGIIKAECIQPRLLFNLRFVTALKWIKCPVLAPDLAKDIQVAPENLVVIEKATWPGRNQQVTAKEFSNRNYLNQNCETGTMDEYSAIGQTPGLLVLGNC